MPWGWECREKLIKQNVLQPTKRTHPIAQDTGLPGPNHYEPPVVVGRPGYSKIKREPAYSFGLYLKAVVPKPAARPNAKLYDISGFARKGLYRIPGSVITPHIEPVAEKTMTPGPAAYVPLKDPRYKNPPAYSIRQVAKPPYQSGDVWTPPPNMYLPPLAKIKKKPPAYSLGSSSRHEKPSGTPGPGEHDPKFEYVMKTKPAFSFGSVGRKVKQDSLPAPNAYCSKKFNVNKRSTPAPSFGIRHSKYLGETTVFEKPSDLKIDILGA